ncbi:hypothetical protein K439DRAFT_1658456 [Ramaria rubella]|nr:hypothetical protein K439DRAFT_1658456 [Ramaria rubella]
MDANTFEVELWLYFPEQASYFHVLSIPLEECFRFSLKPLKWLRYLGYAIYGGAGRLETGTSEDHLQEVDYGGAIEARQYYFRSEDPLRFVDVDGVDDKITTLAATPRRTQLERELLKRDVTCVFTNIAANECQGPHSLPHSKDDEYVRRVTELRADSDDVINSIDDVRNAFLVYSGLHMWWGRGGLALLKTPNFALASSDIDHHSGAAPSADKTRFVLHHITLTDPHVANLAPHNMDVRLPAQMDQWPPSFLTDAWYACCAYNAWKAHDTVDTLKKISKKQCYSDPESVDQHSGVPNLRMSGRAEGKCVKETNIGENDEPSEMASAMDFILSLWMRSLPEDVEARREASKEVQRKKEEEISIRVQNWLQAA